MPFVRVHNDLWQGKDCLRLKIRLNSSENLKPAMEAGFTKAGILACGLDGTRTRDLRRDRAAF